MNYTPTDLVIVIAAVGAQAVLIIGALRPQIGQLLKASNGQSTEMRAEIRALRDEVAALRLDKAASKETAAVLAATTARPPLK